MSECPPATDARSSSPSASSLRLLLHCVDGTFPFLTPHLLSKCFPPHQVNDILLLGISVRDTCVAPYYSNSSDTDSKQKQQQEQEQKQTNKRKKNPRGYTFSTTVQPDSWLLPYQRVTLPTFDLLQDVAMTVNNSTKPQQTLPSVVISATDQHVDMWTANGRIALTMKLYQGAVQSLASSVQVTLFDAILPVPNRTNYHMDELDNDNNNNNDKERPKVETNATARAQRESSRTLQRREKRTARAVARTRAFFRTALECEEEESSGTPTIIKWMPLLLDANTSATLEGQLQELTKESSSTATASSSNIKGVALIGWQHLDENMRREQLERTLQQQQQQPCISTVAVLATSCLRHILEIAATAKRSKQQGLSVVIGSSLPTEWARDKKAFLVNFRQKALQEDSPPTKKPRTEHIELSNLQLDADGCVPLNDESVPPNEHSWFQDKRPLVHSCQCFTCATHSRSYIYHLVRAKEILAEILLFIHNLHHLLDMLRALESGDNANDLVESILSQLGQDSQSI